jgi:hypothetical protein
MAWHPVAMQLIYSPSGFSNAAFAMTRFKAHGIVLRRRGGLKPPQR